MSLHNIAEKLYSKCGHFLILVFALFIWINYSINLGLSLVTKAWYKSVLFYMMEYSYYESSQMIRNPEPGMALNGLESGIYKVAFNY
jgi:hypothetical protein